MTAVPLPPLPHQRDDRSEPAGRREVVALTGEVDAATVARLELTLGPLIEHAPVGVAIDLTGVTRMTTECMSALIGAVRRADRADRSLIVLAEPPPVRRSFELAGLAELLGEVGGTPEERAGSGDTRWRERVVRAFVQAPTARRD